MTGLGKEQSVLGDSEAQSVFFVGSHLGSYAKAGSDVWLLSLPLCRAHVKRVLGLDSMK